VSICHKWPCHERVLSRTFVVPQIVKTYEILAHEHVGFFALLSSSHGLLLGYIFPVETAAAWDTCWRSTDSLVHLQFTDSSVHIGTVLLRKILPAGRHTMFVCLCTNSCVRGKTAAAWGICRLRLSWRTLPNFKTRDGSPPATAFWALFSVCLHRGREWQDTLYMKFLSTTSVTFSEEKKGEGGLASQLFHVSLAGDHPKVMTDNLVYTATKKDLWHEGKTVGISLLMIPDEITLVIRIGRERGLASLDSGACLVLWWCGRAIDVRKHTVCDTQEGNLTVSSSISALSSKEIAGVIPSIPFDITTS